MNWLRNFAALSLMLVTVTGAIAQPDTVWTRVYGGPGDEVLSAIRPTSDGGTLIRGTFTVRADSSYSGLMKVAMNGDSLWTVSLPPIGTLSAMDGDTAIFYSFQNGTIRFTLLGPTGEIIRSYADSTYTPNGGPYTFTQTSDSGMVFYGSIGDTLCVVKISREGDSLWCDRFRSDYNLIYTKSTADLNGGVFVGMSVTFGNDADIRLVHILRNGWVEFDQSYTGQGDSKLYNLWPSEDGGVLLFAGWSDPQSLHFVHIVPNGNAAGVSQQIPYDSLGSTFKITLLQEDRYLVSSYYQFFGNSNDIVLKEVNVAGDVLWSKVLGGPGDEFSPQISVYPDGSFMTVCRSNSFYRGRFPNNDFWLVKFASEFNGVGKIEPQPNRITLLSAYPNPFNSRTTIEYHLDRPGFVTLGVYDVAGRLVKEWAGSSRETGGQFQWDASGVAAGWYQARLGGTNGTASKGILLVK